MTIIFVIITVLFPNGQADAVAFRGPPQATMNLCEKLALPSALTKFKKQLPYALNFHGRCVKIVLEPKKQTNNPKGQGV